MSSATQKKSVERKTLEGIYALNTQCLDWLARQGILGDCSEIVRHRMAHCPFPLVNFRWQDAQEWGKTPPVVPATDWVDVAQSALTLAWWTCQANVGCAMALLGLAPEVVGIVSALSPCDIGRIARCESAPLQAYSIERDFLEELREATERNTVHHRRHVHLRGLQILLGQIT